MVLFALFIRTGIFAEGRFLGKVLDEWINDLQEFVHAKLPHLLVICLVAVTLSRLISIGTNHMAAVAERRDGRPGRHSQIKTFASILRTTLNAILWALTAIQILEITGINLAPLLASAGIAGVAIGLAAQTIVKDILNGMLIILEGQFNVGETVRLTGMTGVVEAMTLRHTQIRDGDGSLYIVPNSQITTVANLSRDYSAATVSVAVDFSASPDKVIKLLTSIAMNVRNDPGFAPLFLKDPEVLGVDAISGSQLVIPVVFRTLPLKQYGPIREFRRRVRLAFEENDMLPGDPNRIFRQFPGESLNHDRLPEDTSKDSDDQPRSRPRKEKPAIDPTTIPSVTQNPLVGE